MKLFNKTWKLGVSLFLCLCLLSMTVFASDGPAMSDPVSETELSDNLAAEPFVEDRMQREGEKEEESETEETKDPEGTVSGNEGETVKEPAVTVPEDEKESKTDSLEKTDESSETEAVPEESENEPEGIKPGTVVKSGDCGFVRGTMFYNVTFFGNEQYKLTIYGTGKMLTIGATYGAPWHDYSEGIVSIEIQEGVESIAQFAFTDCDRVTSLTIPASVTTLYKNSIQMRGLKEVYFLGSWSEKFRSDAFDRTEDLKVYYNQNDPSWEGKSFANATMQSDNISLIFVEASDASCTTDGNLSYYYNEAWDKYFSDAEGKLEITDKTSMVIPAFGHDWDTGVVTTEATAEEEGVMTYTCLRCDVTRTESIPVLPNDSLPDDSIPDEGTPDEGTPDEGTPDENTPDENLPAEDVTEDEMQGSEDAGEDILINVNLTIKGQPESTLEGKTQAVPVSAGSVKTADDNHQVLYFALLLISFGAILLLLRRRINR